MSRNIWVISDTHFNHENIIKFCGRPFDDAKQMNDHMVTMWNETVKPQDKVYHLGDVYIGGGFGREYTEHLLSSLHGHKRLILGNHDNGKDQLLLRYFEKIDVWRMFTNFGLLLTHVPVHEDTLYRGQRPHTDETKKLMNVHGHIHERVVTKKLPPDDIYDWRDVSDEDYRCVCVEHTDYRPINIEELRKW